MPDSSGILNILIKIKNILSLRVQGIVFQVFFLGILAIGFLSVFQWIAAEDRASPVYFYSLSSDSMMQTLPIAGLREHPLESLYFLHMQPPLFDLIRTVTATVFVDSNITDQTALIHAVDSILQGLYLVLYAVLSAMIFLWIKLATNSSWFAGVAAFGWMIYPTPIFMSTLLDGTLLSTVLITWMILEIWLIYQGRGNVARLGVAVLLCFFARSFFQWYFLPVVMLSVVLVGMRGRRLGVLFMVIVLGAGGYLIKQYALFGTISTSTFSGEHLSGVLWIPEANPAGGLVWTGKDTDAYREMIDTRKENINLNYPTEAHSYAGGYNTEQQWALNFIHSEIAKEKCVSDRTFCLAALWTSLRQNWPEYWYVEGWGNSVLTDRLPGWYKRSYFRLVTRYLWFLLLSISIFVILRSVQNKSGRPGWLKIFGLTLVPGFILGVCIFGNRFDWYEGGRMKFFLEPVYLVLIASQIYLFGSQLLCKLRAKLNLLSKT